MSGTLYFFEDCDQHMFTLGESCPACRVEQLERERDEAKFARDLEFEMRKQAVSERDAARQELSAAQAVIEAARALDEACEAARQCENPDAPDEVLFAELVTSVRGAIRAYDAAREQP